MTSEIATMPRLERRTVLIAAWTVPAVLTVVTAGSFWATISRTINHDIAWYLVATARWLDGAELYREIVEINPPLAFFLTVPAIVLSESLGILSATAFVAWVFLLVSVSLFLTWRLACGLPDKHGMGHQAFVAVALVALALLPGVDFGQREHLMVIFALPYIVLQVVRVGGNRPSTALSLAVGSWAAFGFALKPYFLLLPAVLEIYRLARTRDIRALIRPETVAVAGLLVLYLLIIVVATPSYLTLIVPYARFVYFAYDGGLSNLIADPRSGILFALFVGFLCAAARRTIHGRTALEVFLIASLALLLVYYIQGKGWTYHLYPALAMLVIAGGVSVLSWRGNAQGAKGGEGRQWLGLVLAGLVPVFLVTDAQFFRSRHQNAFFDAVRSVVREHAGGSSFYAFYAHVWATYPLPVYEDVTAASRYPALWLLPGLVRQSSRGRPLTPDEERLRREIEHFAIDTVVEDMRRDPPALVLVDVRPRKSYFGERPFDYIDFFSRDERFAAIWSSYELAERMNGLDIYTRRERP